MKFDYEIKGVVLDEYDMQRIKEHYERCCTAEYLVENFDLDEELALRLAGEVRRLMNKYNYDEEEAIREVFGKEGIVSEEYFSLLNDKNSD